MNKYLNIEEEAKIIKFNSPNNKLTANTEKM